MKRQIAMIALLFLGMGMTASAQFGKKFNVGKALQAGKDVVSAVTLSDADIANMSKGIHGLMDAHNPLTKPDTEYGKRLEKLTGHIKEMDGLKLNFGVYEVVDVNAFACGDGSVRICAGLMDVMTDEEVMAVIGHEIGHVIHTDSKDAMKNAYFRSAVKNAAGAASSQVAKLTDSELGSNGRSTCRRTILTETRVRSRCLRRRVLRKNNIDPYAMANALTKLAELAKKTLQKSSYVQRMFSSHPDTAKRIERAKAKADSYKKIRSISRFILYKKGIIKGGFTSIENHFNPFMI